MSIDWKSLKAAKKQTSPFMALILGTSGAGKSTLIGSLNKPTLYLYAKQEDHGVAAAGALNKNIVPYCIDYSDKGEKLTPDQTFERTLEVLNDKTIVDNVAAVAVDGASELDLIIRKTNSFKKGCLTDKGVHNNYREGEQVIYHLKQITEAMKNLNSLGLHCFLTCAAMVKSLDESGAVSEVTPKLQGFDVAHDLIRSFADVLLVARVNIATESNPEVHPEHVMLFHSQVSKQSRDLKGNIMKTANFSPRVSGLLVDELPPMMAADLDHLLKIKNEKK